MVENQHLKIKDNKYFNLKVQNRHNIKRKYENKISIFFICTSIYETTEAQKLHEGV